MKRNLLIAALCFFSFQLFAADGYHIKLKLTDRKDSMVYLAHYYGKGFPVVYRADSSKLDKHGNAVFDSKEKIVGGIYMILPSDRGSYFEFLLDNGDDIGITATMDHLRGNIKFTNSPVNNDFIEYQNFLSKLADKEKQLKSELAKAKTAEDTAQIRKEAGTMKDEMEQYRNTYMNRHPTTLLASIFAAMRTVDIPEGTHYTADGKVDSSFAYRYYKNHFWDGFNWSDNRLIHTPLLQTKLDEYFNKIVYQQEDSVIQEADNILQKAKGSEDLFKFTLNWLSTNAQTSKVMGMDKVFVHLVEDYYMKGDATWLSDDELSKYIDRAKKIAPNVINNPAADFVADDAEGKEHRLYDFKAKYTLLVFYSSDCGHCQHELPLLDSVYKAELKDKGVRVIAFNVHNNEDQWRKLLEKDKLDGWLNLWDPKYKSKFWLNYDTQLVPAIYLLDQDKIIRGKKLDHTNIAKVIDIIERKAMLGRK
jgi:thiol-disulfide isomerase/thioredoxin